MLDTIIEVLEAERRNAADQAARWRKANEPRPYRQVVPVENVQAQEYWEGRVASAEAALAYVHSLPGVKEYILQKLDEARLDKVEAIHRWSIREDYYPTEFDNHAEARRYWPEKYDRLTEAIKYVEENL